MGTRGVDAAEVVVCQVSSEERVVRKEGRYASREAVVFDVDEAKATTSGDVETSGELIIAQDHEGNRAVSALHAQGIGNGA